MIDKIKNSPLNLQATSVYNFNEYSLVELLNKYFTTINQCVDSSNTSLQFLTWLKGEGLPIETEKELNKMYEDGRLTQVIDTLSGNLNEKILDVNSELEQTKTITNEKILEVNSQLNTTVKEIGNRDYFIQKANVSPKYIYFQDDSICIVTQKPNKKGYIRLRLNENIVTETDSVGGNSEFFRVTQVLNVINAFTMNNREYTNSNETLWVDQNAFMLQDDTKITIPCRYLSSKTSGAWIEYKITTPPNVLETTLLVYGSSGSSQNVSIFVNDIETLTNLDFSRSTSGFFEVKIPLKTSGENRIKIVTNTSAFLTIGGINKISLKEYKEGYSYDSKYVAQETTINHYVNNNGAMDYALLQDNNIWCGSYHGGELRKKINFVLDGVSISLTKDNDFYIGNVFEVEQNTTIVNKIETYSRQIFESDGSIELQVYFNGDINLKKLFTNMSTSHNNYTECIYPKYINMETSNDGDYFLPSGINYIVQKNPENNQKCITIINNSMLQSGKVPKPYIKKSSGNYNKIYNANIDVEDSFNFKGGNFKCVHIFE